MARKILQPLDGWRGYHYDGLEANGPVHRASSSMDRDDRPPTLRIDHKKKKVGNCSLWETEASERKEADGLSIFETAAVAPAEKKKCGRPPLQLYSKKPTSQTEVPDVYILNVEALKNTTRRPSKQDVIDGVEAPRSKHSMQTSAVEATHSLLLGHNSERGVEIGPSKQGWRPERKRISPEESDTSELDIRKGKCNKHQESEDGECGEEYLKDCMAGIENQIKVIGDHFDVLKDFLAISQLCYLKFEVSDLSLQIAELKKDRRELTRHVKIRWELPYTTKRQRGV
ncbi:unnamed protein product [Calypogeia fissa]